MVIRVAGKRRKQVVREADRTSPVFDWRNHIPLLISFVGPVIVICQVSALSGYNRAATIAILGSAGSLSILLRASFATVSLFVLMFSLMILALASSRAVFNYWLSRSSLGGVRQIPYIWWGPALISTVLITALTPWPLLLCALGLKALLFGQALSIQVLAYRAGRRAARLELENPERYTREKERYSPERIGASSPSAMLFVVVAAVPLMMINSWMPFEAIKLPDVKPFTAYVVSSDSDNLVILRVQERTIQRIDSGAIRELCNPKSLSILKGGARGATATVASPDWTYRSTLLELMMRTRPVEYPACPVTLP